MSRMSVASTCLLVGSFCVGAMGLLWFGILVIGLFAGVAGVGGAAVAHTMTDYQVPAEVLFTGGAFYIGAMALMTVVALANLIGCGLGLFAAFLGYRGRGWGLRIAAGVHVAMAVVFGLPGLITMNPLALVWAVVLGLAIGTFVATPRPVDAVV